MRKEVWDGMLDADMNARYWSCLTRRYTKRDTYTKIFLAIMSSGSVASWSIWGTIPSLWKVLSAISAVIAVSLPVINFQGTIQKLSDAAGKWLQIQVDYENLWVEINNTNMPLDINRYQDIRKREFAVKAGEHALPYDEKLLNASQNAVLISRGLNKESIVT
jgi:hypothetical protein